MRKTLVSLVTLTVFLMAAPLIQAQAGNNATVSDQDLQLLRKDLRSMKKQLVAANMELTDAEAQKFWPVYDRYTVDSEKIYDARYAILKEYADNIKTLTDPQAVALARRWSDTDQAAVQLRMKY